MISIFKVYGRYITSFFLLCVATWVQSEHIISFGSRDALILPEGELAATGKELVND